MSIHHRFLALFLILLAPVGPLALAGAADEPQAGVILPNGARGVGGPVAVPINLTEVAGVLGLQEAIRPERIAVVWRQPGSPGVPLLAQFDPAEDFDATAQVGTLRFLAPPGQGEVGVWFTGVPPNLPPPTPVPALQVSTEDGRITVRNAHYTVTHDPRKLGGLPCRFEFGGSGKVFDTYAFNDRVYRPDLGGFSLRYDPQPQLELLASGPVCAVVRVRARYLRPDGTAPESRPAATYTFVYYAHSPEIEVRAEVSQQKPTDWSELHIIELNFPDESFTHWAAGDPLREGPLEADRNSERGSDWAALVDGYDMIGLMRAGGAMIYDGRGEYGTYLHGPWVSWGSTEATFTAALWVGTSQEGPAAVRRAAAASAGVAGAYVVVPSLQRQLEGIRERLAALPRGGRRGRFAWALAQVEGRARAGRLTAAQEAARGLLEALQAGEEALAVAGEPGLLRLDNGRIGLGFDVRPDGVGLVSFFDLEAERELLSGARQPLWRATARDAQGTVQFDGLSGWGEVTADWPEPRSGEGGREVTWYWGSPQDPRLAGLKVTARLVLDGPQAACSLRIDNDSPTVGLSRVGFVEVATGPLGGTAEDDVVIFPRGAGERATAPLLKPFGYSSTYPNGWCTMQFMAVYDGESGLYVGMHDPQASTKDIRVEHPAGTNELRFAYDWPVPDMHRPGNDFESAPAVLRVFRGDWFDAAQIYKAWVRAEAPWWPRGPRVGRETPEWFQDIAVWALGGGRPEDCVAAVKAFGAYMGVPTAFHWYNWHQIPFDDNYPHYFPAKDGFAEGVRELQAAGVRVMPYINGRLWDTDTEDFPTRAQPFATKNEQGQPYIEEYGSGAKLAPMCPTTDLWRQTVRDTVLRLQNEVGVDGVYIDQVAAAGPVLCFDAGHGHPLGGGHWWTVDGYWPLLTALRQQMGPDKFITTECNAEPYLHLFDGYLTWHWQFNGQIPLFPAVYGGQIQLFSRAYRGGPTKDLALRMKAAQQLVFGEQLGWIDPNVIQEENNGPFLRRMARLRYALRDYLARGEMARPPTLLGNLPEVTADWQWSGEWPVTDTALQRGAWRAADGRLALLFINVADEELQAELVFDGPAYGFPADATLTVTPRTEEGPGQPTTEPASFRRTIALAPHQALALEVSQP